jgi:hypothetical protein
VIGEGANHDARGGRAPLLQHSYGKKKALADLDALYLLASLRAGLLHDEAALQRLSQATNDTAVREMLFRKPEEFRLAR